MKHPQRLPLAGGGSVDVAIVLALPDRTYIRLRSFSGGSGTAYLTPAEARSLAAMLNRVAAEADSDTAHTSLP